MVQRIFIPGSEWLYFKIYSGAKTADEILVRTVYPYIEELRAEKSADSFFFIRYADPDFHIRLRLHIVSPTEYAVVFEKFIRYFQPEVDNGAITKIMCDTYTREIERYGAASIGAVEELFRADSAAIIEFLRRLSGLGTEQRETVRWTAALVLLDDTLTACGYDLAEKVRMTGRMAESYKREFGFTSHGFTKQLNDKYRFARKDIEQALAGREGFGPYEDILHARKTQIGAIAGQIEEIRRSGATIPAADDLLFSIQHMTMNRWFRSRNRQHELVVYDFLNKFYASAYARRNKESKDTEAPENL
ncbi:thiopeptide-type bacteriocin biosynthesis protein [uncultured Alistipes sp.]|jgi:thiopeptide-type bacteriocin biosynthesis domain|uniref:thiopeptide-type bacteriocin biosynthesis protein n=1 Tax=uncultured Alistipes sp. TaxID=538949 RepID=UPI0025FD9B17|nr:thiopeptide-type bacteriocin biosynthesis protein [uncultured Alistipes sp.]